jgi:superfamily II DNA or RNA helicase
MASNPQPESARPIRLAYELTVAGPASGVRLVARANPRAPALAEQELKRMQDELHALDKAIVREVHSSLVFGQLGDAGAARLLPLLAQRPTRVGDAQLELDDDGLTPRVRVERSPGGLRLVLGFSDVDGDWVDLTGGRLLAGSQAFFVRGHRASPVSSPAAWELTAWARSPVLDLSGAITPLERDDLVRNLTKVGVPEEDLSALAVRRGPADRIIVRFVPPEGDTLVAQAALEMEYCGERVNVGGNKPDSVYVVPAGGQRGGVIERDIASEEAARRHMRSVGFRFDKETHLYVARGETAIRALDPDGEVFPGDWLVDRSAHAPRFRRDLSLDTEVTVVEERGLIDVQVDVQTTDDDSVAAALVEMRDLIEWLHSGNRYVELPDGSFVAPSPRFRRNLRLIEDLGAEAGRALVSPLCVGLLRSLGNGSAVAAADAATQAWLDELSGASTPQRVVPPESLQAVLREYQQRGLDWLGMLHRHRLTGILADDMGLGKTLQTLALLLAARVAEGPKPSLVVAPTSVVTVWRDEAARFTPELTVALWHGPPSERHAIDPEEYDLVVTSYGVLRRDADRLAACELRYAILDEAQSAKNAATQNARAIRRLTSERRLALTGTPIENRLEELWAAFDFLAPGFLGNLRQFRKRYARPIANGDEEVLALLRARIQPLVLRRLKGEVARELPPKIETTVRCEMLPAQRALYDHLAGRLRDNVKKKIEKVGIERARMDILAALTRLRQICADPALIPAPNGTRAPPSAKLELFEELMREALASERRVVVFSQFVQMQKRLIAVIKRLGVEPLWLHGGTRKRDKVVDAFQSPSGPPVIVVSLKAGGTGLTLTRADTVMHYDPWWNPAVERQATDRTHRLGQRHQVTVYKLVCARSIEERVASMAVKKDALAADLLSSEGGSGAKHISVEEVMQLLG